MTTLREAAQAALEALESLQGGCTDSNDGTVEALTVWCPEIIDALRSALAEPDLNLADPAVQKRLAAQWGYTKGEPHGEPAGRVRIDRGEVHFVPRLRDADVAGFVDGQPLYTTPPALKREPLTDEQIAALVLRTVYEGDASTPHRDAWAAEIGIPFARAIEQEHGIRPNYRANGHCPRRTDDDH